MPHLLTAFLAMLGLCFKGKLDSDSLVQYLMAAK
jgi:hypothetical protein